MFLKLFFNLLRDFSLNCVWIILFFSTESSQNYLVVAIFDGVLRSVPQNSGDLWPFFSHLLNLFQHQEIFLCFPIRPMLHEKIPFYFWVQVAQPSLPDGFGLSKLISLRTPVELQTNFSPLFIQLGAIWNKKLLHHLLDEGVFHRIPFLSSRFDNSQIKILAHIRVLAKDEGDIFPMRLGLC